MVPAPLTLTAITSFLLAFTFAFYAGRLMQAQASGGSPRRLWAWALFVLGVANLVGGIDHGFIEPVSLEAREPFMRTSWLLVGVVTLLVLLTTAGHFFPPKINRAVRVVAFVQLALYSVAVFLIDSYLVVILNYAPVILLLLGFSLAGLRTGRGSPAMVGGVLVLIAASIVQASGVDVLSPLDENGLYHVLAVFAVPFLYAGGMSLSPEGP